MPTLTSLYNLSTGTGINIYNAQNTLIGTTTNYKAIAHNGKCIGSIQINTGDEEVWISGYGWKSEDGIMWLEIGKEGHRYFMTTGITNSFQCTNI